MSSATPDSSASLERGSTPDSTLKHSQGSERGRRRGTDTGEDIGINLGHQGGGVLVTHLQSNQSSRIICLDSQKLISKVPYLSVQVGEGLGVK